MAQRDGASVTIYLANPPVLIKVHLPIRSAARILPPLRSTNQAPQVFVRVNTLPGLPSTASTCFVSIPLLRDRNFASKLSWAEQPSRSNETKSDAQDSFIVRVLGPTFAVSGAGRGRWICKQSAVPASTPLRSLAHVGFCKIALTARRKEKYKIQQGGSDTQNIKYEDIHAQSSICVALPDEQPLNDDSH